MHTRLLKTREGFTLVEVIVAMTITAIIGAAVTGVFVTQSRFFDHQEKTSFARGVSRGAINVMMSELRMIERGGGVATAAAKKVKVRAPYALGVTCGATASSSLVISLVPADTIIRNAAVHSGYAFRSAATGTYGYIASQNPVAAGSDAALCDASPRVARIPADSGGSVVKVVPAVGLPKGTPILLYQEITYEFKASESVPGRIGLYRQVGTGTPQELVAPFDTSARFRFYVNDAATAVNNAPSTLSQLTGLQLVLDGLSERPNRDGTLQRVSLETSVFFRNR